MSKRQPFLVASLTAILGTSCIFQSAPSAFSNSEFRLPASETRQISREGEVNGEAKMLQAVAAPSQLDEKIQNYIDSLKIDTTDSAKAKDLQTAINGLLRGSTQFLYCESLEDWSCLEKTPALTPTVNFRVEPINSNFGRPIMVDKPFEMEHFFTQQWFYDHKEITPAVTAPSVAEQLGARIKKFSKKSLKMALYGIDDITGTMKPVYSEIVNLVKTGVPVYGVFDSKSGSRPNSMLRKYDIEVEGNHVNVTLLDQLNFSYEPNDQLSIYAHPKWMDTIVESNPEEFVINSPKKNYIGDVKWVMRSKSDSIGGVVRMPFQYKGTMQLITEMNKAAELAQKPEEIRARLEWPASNIMHNKFLIMDDGAQKYVWAGTANVARTCMGAEKNSNMSVFIKSNEIAAEFEKQFNQMYEADPRKRANPLTPGLVTGAYHTSKTPVSNRYFKFKDGTDVRLHFAPTDDGSHRAIIPMLLSAKAGDHIRISMFGMAGIEMVRSMQKAVANGARVQLILDHVTGSGQKGVMKSPTANVFETNPYGGKGFVETKVSAWGGLNHHKTATRTRNGVAHVIIIGSQNWSQSGNDSNDENMITIRNEKGILAAKDFNTEFDTRLWESGCLVETRADLDGRCKASEDVEGEDGEEDEDDDSDSKNGKDSKPAVATEAS